MLGVRRYPSIQNHAAKLAAVQDVVLKKSRGRTQYTPTIRIHATTSRYPSGFSKLYNRAALSPKMRLWLSCDNPALRMRETVSGHLLSPCG